MQTDGNFILYDGYGSATWASNTNTAGPSVELLLQDDGNLVLYGDRAQWSPASERSWYDRLCARITCKLKYKTVYGSTEPGAGGPGDGGGGGIQN